MSSIDPLIHNFSLAFLEDFFIQKIPTFRPEREVFTGLIAEHERFSDPVKLGAAALDDGNELLVFTCPVSGSLTLRSSKKKQFEIAKKVLKEDFKDGAIFVFYDNDGAFRFSFIRRYYGEAQKYSNWKRFTYYINPQRQNKTFKKTIGTQCDFLSLDNIEKAFSVEALSKAFYQNLSYWYFASLAEVKFPEVPDETKAITTSNAMIRLITRMIFVWFMKQKGLIPDEIFQKEQLDEWLNYDDKTGSTYYKAILQNLFFATLNTEMGEKRKWITTKGFGVQHFYRYRRFFRQGKGDEFLALMRLIPYLNGGLFENLDIVETADKEEGTPKKEIRIDCFSDNPKNEEKLKVPDYLFFGKRQADISTLLDDKKKNKVEIEGLIDLLERYDFTIDENSQDDLEVALDPELLGTVFENLLASYNPETQSTARKESGSFYTPRPIVDYMVKESLLYFLKDKSQTSAPALRHLMATGNADELDNEQKHQLVEALTHVKILDPACGSGAFPMGCLQRMVQLLNALDPGNRIYKEKLQQKLKQELAKTIDDSNYDELKNNIDEVFTNQQFDPDYARKLFLIQNCLYGVDIQPIAMQITKLRFFISLLVEQQTDDSAPNLGVKPLPNLETKFVAANTLIGMKTSINFKSEVIYRLENELEECRERYFNARTYTTKRKYRARLAEIQKEMANELIRLEMDPNYAHQIATWNPFDPNTSNPWFAPQWMFGCKKFDIVIGNPPYIQLQKAIGETSTLKFADLYKNEQYETFQRTGDIYTLFYERGLQLTKNSGILCYITSNKWMRAGYGKSLRSFFCKKNPLLLLDLGPGIFDAATVDTNILLIRNKKVKQQQLKAFTLENKNQIHQLTKAEMTDMQELSDESWIILKPEEMAIKKKIERLGTPLKDWDIDIYRGVLTGYNDAFIIDGEKRKQLIAEDPKSEEIIKPILRGRDIKRYKAEFADLWLINSHNGYKKKDGTKVPRIKIEDYPAVKRHLDNYWEKIEKRYDKGDTPYNLRNCAYLQEFEKEVIPWQRITQQPRFCLTKRNTVILDSMAFLSAVGITKHYLLALLNSKFIYHWVKNNVHQYGNTGFRLSNQYVVQIPIPKISKEAMQPFKEKVNQILAKKAAGEDSRQEKAEIDLMVYRLYGLNYEEVRVVDPEFWLSKAAYEGVEV